MLKYLLILFFFCSSVALACTSGSVFIDGKLLQCITCCNNNICTTTCV
jgi:hypothetical protein